MQSRKMLLGFSVVLLCATASVGQKKTAAPAPQVDPANKLQGLDDLAAQAMQQWKVPGLAIGIVQNGKVIYAKGYGFRDVEHKLPVNTDTLFPIGSISKSFTSLAFAMLNDEGKVDWDKSVRTYLPEFQMNDPVASEHAVPRRPQPVLQRLPAARRQPAAAFRPLGGPERVQIAPLDQVLDPSQVLRRALELMEPRTEALVHGVEEPAGQRRGKSPRRINSVRWATRSG